MSDQMYSSNNSGPVRGTLDRYGALCRKTIALGAMRNQGTPFQKEEIAVVTVRTVNITRVEKNAGRYAATVRLYVEEATFFGYPIEYLELDLDQPSQVSVRRNLDNGYLAGEPHVVVATFDVIG